MYFWCLQFPPKNDENKSNSSKIEFVRSFFGGNAGLKKSFQFCLTFRTAAVITIGQQSQRHFFFVLEAFLGFRVTTCTGAISAMLGQ